MAVDRFHNKYHFANHHTNSTAGLYDSATDPLAAQANPFQGNFYLNGVLSAHGVITDVSYVNILSAGGYATTITTVLSNYSILANNQTLFVNAVSSISLILPLASAVPNQEFTIKNISTHSVVLSAQAPNLIDGQYGSILLNVQESLVHLVSYQNNYWILYQQ